jgi:hypothetical protein
VTGQPRGQRHDLVRQHTVPVTVELHPDEMDCTELGERAGQELAKAALVSQGGFVLRSFYRAFGRALPLAALLGTLVLAGCARPDPTTAFPDEPPTTATTAPPPTTVAAACPTVLVGCPRPDVTPGAVIPSTDGVCTRQYNKRGRLATKEKRRIWAAYGIRPDTRVIEIDHLIARWAGGASIPANLWPMVDATEAKRKDSLEQRLYNTFCHRNGAQIDPAAVWQACGDSHLTLECARKMMKEFWRWF